jgi:hypothetical protein
MDTNKLVLFIIVFSLLFVSCKKSSTPTSPTFHVQVSMEIIPYQSAPATVESTLGYIKQFVEWNPSGIRDTTKADSLAQWFAQSPYRVTDMWFPEVDSRCAIPINTENVVTLELAAPDTNLKSLGYSSETAVVSPCYVYYRHYVFTKVQNGT